MRRMITCLLLTIVAVTAAADEPITLKDALERLLHNTTRGKIISGQREVSEAKFKAERIGYYLPEISINSTLPSYSLSETYQNYSGAADPIPFEGETTSGFGNIQLKQKVITGGDITVEGRINISNREYPDPLYDFVDNRLMVTDVLTATDKRRLRDFRMEFSQPLLQTSGSRSTYLAARHALEKADIDWRVARANLKKEGLTAFFDLLIADLDRQVAEYESELGAYNAKWDSVKFADSVITEAAWIESKSARLEKRLGLFDARATYEEKANEFRHLLDLPSGSEVVLDAPPSPQPPDANSAQWYLENAQYSGETELARLNMENAERQLKESRSSAGINGTLNASYSVGRGTVTRVKEDGEQEDKINTNEWQVSLDFSYPIWDGGASGANVHSQELSYESARLEYLAAQRNAQNKMEILLKRIEINDSKLSLLDQELDLAGQKLQEAEDQHEMGLISDGTLMENRVYYLEAQKNRLATLKDYYLDLTELEKTDLPG